MADGLKAAAMYDRVEVLSRRICDEIRLAEAPHGGR